MYLKKLILLFFIAIGVCSCKENNTIIENELMECVNRAVNDNSEYVLEKPIDFYSLSIELENILLKNDILKNNSQEEYSQLFNNIINEVNDKHKDVYNLLIAKMNEARFDFNLAVINISVFSKCPYSVSVEKKENEGKIIFSYVPILDEIMNNGYDNQELLKKLLKNSDNKHFDKIVYRAPVILLVMINLDSRYNPDLKN